MIKYFVKQTVFTNLIAFFVTVLGLVSYLTMRREAFPSISMDLVVISTIFPGAGPKEVETLVTTKIEEAIERVDGIKRFQSVSVENRSSVAVFIDPDFGDADKVISAIQREVGRINDLPADADDPLVEELGGFWPAVIVSVGSDRHSDLEVREKAKELREKLEDIGGVGEVSAAGMRDREIWVEADPSKLDAQALTIANLVDALARRNIQLPGGRLTLNGQEVLVRTSGELERAGEIPGIVIRGNDEGSRVRVSDVAQVSDQLREARQLNRVEGKPGVSLHVKKKVSGDIFKVLEGVNAVVNDFRAKNPGFNLLISDDTSQYVRRRLDVTLSNAAFGFVFVLILLMLFLNPVAALWTATGMVVALFLGIAIADGAGQTINLMTLFGFVMVLGMLVDDGIVISENIFQKMEAGLDPETAAVEGTREVALPILASVTTTIAAFLPLVLMPGIMGKFLGLIPKVVIACLIGSLIESLLILPNHMAHTAHWARLRAFAWLADFRARLVEPRLKRLINAHVNLLAKFTARPKTTLLVAVAAMLIMIVGSISIVGFKLFPVGIDEFNLAYKLKVGASLERSLEMAKRIEAEVAKLPKSELAGYLSTVGQAGELDTPEFGSHLGQVRVILTQPHEREREGDAIADEIRAKISKLPGLESLDVARRRAGPPVGKPVSVILRGDDFASLRLAAEATKKKLAELKGVKDISDNVGVGKREKVIRVDERRASLAGLTVQQVAAAVRGALDGIEATEIRKGDEETVVRVRFPVATLRDEGILQRIKVLTPRGYRAPLLSLARVEEGSSVLQLTRYDGKPAITVSADVDGKEASSFSANQALAKDLPETLKKFEGVSFKLAGENEDTQETLVAMPRLFGIALLLIFIILATQFGSLLQPLIVMISIPFGLAGVSLTLLMHHEPMSMLAMLGTVAMAGVVVNNAILLVEFSNNALDSGLSPREAVLEAARRRLRAIYLTSATTVAGLLPLAYGIGGWEPFLAPMAKVLGWSILVSGFTTVIVVPCLWLTLLPWMKAHHPVAKPEAPVAMAKARRKR